MVIIKNQKIKTTVDLDIDFDEIWEGLTNNEITSLLQYIIEWGKKEHLDMMKEALKG